MNKTSGRTVRGWPRSTTATTIDDLQIAADDREQIVEVVGHAAGQLPDRFHLLRLSKHVLGLAPIHTLLREGDSPH
ncbi:hypothetical protein V1288_003711 [Bradyrhizobium sp. AZCC 2176]